MVQGYYDLDEAAKILGMVPDKLSQMAQRREIRAFADRGTWRFRTQDVEEMARRLGRGSSPDLQLGESAPPSKSATPSPSAAGPKSAPPRAAGDQVEIGQEVLSSGSSKKRKSQLSP